MEEEYNCLVVDVAGPTFEGFCHFETALDEAENECAMNYGVSLDELLETVGKTREDLKIDAINQLKEWSHK